MRPEHAPFAGLAFLALITIVGVLLASVIGKWWGE